MDISGTIFGSGIIALILLACPFTEPQETAVPQQPIVSNPLNASANATLPANVSSPANATPAGNATPPVNSTLPANTSLSSQTELDWALISKGNVESACLSQAKKMAVAGGYSAGLVFSCACSAQETSETKAYDCSVSAIDGAHPLSVNCTKSERACLIDAQGDVGIYTFDQLQALANQ